MQTLAQFVWVPRVQTQSAGSRLSAVSMIFIRTVSLISVPVLNSETEDDATDFKVSFLFSRKSQSTKVFYKEEGQPWSGNNFLYLSTDSKMKSSVTASFCAPFSLLIWSPLSERPNQIIFTSYYRKRKGMEKAPTGEDWGEKAFQVALKSQLR